MGDIQKDDWVEALPEPQVGGDWSGRLRKAIERAAGTPGYGNNMTLWQELSVSALRSADLIEAQAAKIEALKEGLRTAFGGSLTAFPFDPDEGDDESVEITLTRRDVKRLCRLSGVDHVTGALIEGAPS